MILEAKVKNVVPSSDEISSSPSPPQTDESETLPKNFCPRKKNNLLNRFMLFWMFKVICLANKTKLDVKHLQNLCFFSTSEYLSKFISSDYNIFFDDNLMIISRVIGSSKSLLCLGFLFQCLSIMFAGILPYFLIKLLDFSAQALEFQRSNQSDTNATNTNVTHPHILNAYFPDDSNLYLGMGLCFMFVLSFFFERTFELHGHYCIKLIGLRVKSCLTSAVYHKIHKLNESSRILYSNKDLSSLLSTDIEEISGTVDIINYLYSIPLKITIYLLYLYQYFNYSVIVALPVVICLSLFSTICTCICHKYQRLAAKFKNERIKFLLEMVNYIQFLKCCAFENTFITKVNDIRMKEVHFLRKSSRFESLIILCTWLTPHIITFAVLLYYVYSREENILDAKKVTLTVVILILLRSSIDYLPLILGRLLKMGSALKRIKKFLKLNEMIKTTSSKSRELEKKAQSRPLQSNTCVFIKNANFTWHPNSEKIILNDINLIISKNSLIAIIGIGNSGKSSLLSALLGQMFMTSGILNICDENNAIAYVSQYPWTLNDTVRNNIIFTSKYDEIKYKQVLDYCSLNHDISFLKYGDKTVIGDNGIILNAGQKQRISMARAVYSSADIYIFDDPLSYIDNDIAYDIFEKIISSNGILKDRTRIMTTNNFKILPKVDRVVILKNGHIINIGKYDDIKDTNEFKNIYNYKYNDTCDESTFSMSNIKKSMTKTKVKTKKTKASRSKERKLENKSTIKHYKMKLIKDGDTNVIQMQCSNAKLTDADDLQLDLSWKIFCKYFKLSGYLTLTIAIIFNVLSTQIEITSHIWLKHWADLNIESQRKYKDFYSSIYALMIFSHLFRPFLISFLVFDNCFKISIELHNQLMNNIFKYTLNFFYTTPLSYLIARFNRDLVAADRHIPTSLINFINTFIFIPFGFCVLMLASYYMLILALVLSAMFYILYRYYKKAEWQLYHLECLSKTCLYSNINETFNGMVSIRAYKAQKFLKNKFNEKLDSSINCSYYNLAIRQWLDIHIQIIGLILITAQCLVVVLKSHYTPNDMHPALAGLIIFYSIEQLLAFSFLIKSSSILENRMISIGKIFKYCEFNKEAEWFISDLALNNWPNEGIISFHNFSTKYSNELPKVLHNINITIKSGEKICLIGPKYSGKSTFILSLFRIVEATEGKITIDSVDISKIGLHQLRKKLFILPQDPILFDGTIRFNLDPYEEFNDKDIWQALENSNLKTFVSSLEEGINYLIKDAGENIGYNKKHLLSLARILLHKPKIFIFDEPVDSIDSETDNLIRTIIKKHLASSTTITIANRLQTLKECDRILVLSEGMIKDFDNPANILSKSDYVKQLYLNENQKL